MKKKYPKFNSIIHTKYNKTPNSSFELKPNMMFSFLFYLILLKHFVYCNMARLSHVIMPFHPRQLEEVKDNLNIWSQQFLCEKDIKLKGIGFIFYVSSSKTDIPDVNQFEMELFDASKSGMDCFRFVSIIYANLVGEDDGYLKGSRLMFEKMIKKEIDFGPEPPSHIFYMEPDCRPIRPNWLTALNNHIIAPNAEFWMKGSLFRGSFDVILNNAIYNHVHINGNAIYNISDEGFSEFYFKVAKMIVETQLHNSCAYDTDIYRALLWNNSKYTAHFFHMFQYSDFIQNHWHSEYSLNEILETSPNTYFIHGGEQLD